MRAYTVLSAECALLSCNQQQQQQELPASATADAHVEMCRLALVLPAQTRI